MVPRVEKHCCAWAQLVRECRLALKRSQNAQQQQLLQTSKKWLIALTDVNCRLKTASYQRMGALVTPRQTGVAGDL